MTETKSLLAELLKAVQDDHKLKVEHQQYKTKWPCHCTACNATGEVHWTENGAPMGEGFWSMPMSDVCDACTAEGSCPRCGTHVTFEEWQEGTPCPHCGWNWGKNPGDHCPPEGVDGNYWNHLIGQVEEALKE